MAEIRGEVDFSAGGARLRAAEATCRRRLATCSDPEQRALMLNTLGRLLYGQVRFPEAEATYSEALWTWPRLAAAAHNRAEIRYRMGDLAAAERDLLLADSLQPDTRQVAESLREIRGLFVLQASAEHRDPPSGTSDTAVGTEESCSADPPSGKSDTAVGTEESCSADPPSGKSDTAVGTEESCSADPPPGGSDTAVRTEVSCSADPPRP